MERFGEMIYTYEKEIANILYRAYEENGKIIALGTNEYIPNAKSRLTLELEKLFLQLEEYFQKRRKNFDIKMELRGTEFQKLVWNEAMKIPYGEIINYGELAKRIGKPKASRAVGMALSKNPISILMPCHRIIGKNGKLTGYAGGLDIKLKLLNLETDSKFTKEDY
ncbi:MAG: methylated-DNA--[protein]-cysteine S-methyltransferase [Tissierellia bacterium]|nr:methylated-DNA--[protein]-cysteine S-methyltransferase [Tissierellia bacterium]